MKFRRHRILPLALAGALSFGLAACEVEDTPDTVIDDDDPDTLIEEGDDTTIEEGDDTTIEDDATTEDTATETDG